MRQTEFLCLLEMKADFYQPEEPLNYKQSQKHCEEEQSLSTNGIGTFYCPIKPMHT